MAAVCLAYIDEIFVKVMICLRRNAFQLILIWIAYLNERLIWTIIIVSQHFGDILKHSNADFNYVTFFDFTESQGHIPKGHRLYILLY